MKNIPSGQIQLGVWGCCKTPAGPGQSPGGGLGGKAPGSFEEPVIYTT